VERRPARKGGPKPRSVTTSPFANIEWLIAEKGGIDVRDMSPIGCVAAAADQHMCYAMLTRRKGETLLELLQRLDKAIATASETSITVDEVNPPEGFPSSRS
jgi:hypothetical protein